MLTCGEAVCGEIILGQSSGSVGIWRLYPSTEPDTSGSSSSPLAVQSWEELDSTCGSLGHSRHRTAAGHRSLRCHKHCNTCTQCTASGTSSLQPSLPVWTVDMSGGLSVHSLSRTPAPLIGQSFDLKLNPPDRSHSNRWVVLVHWDLFYLLNRNI